MRGPFPAGQLQNKCINTGSCWITHGFLIKFHLLPFPGETLVLTLRILLPSRIDTYIVAKCWTWRSLLLDLLETLLCETYSTVVGY